MVTIHYDISEPSELCPTEWLGKKITDHLISGTVFNGDMSSLYAVGNEEVLNVRVSCPLAAGSASICFEQHRALIVLVYDGGSHWVPLCFKEIPRPQDGWHVVMHSHYFCPSQACGVYFLFVG
jgi:hypothetical protein